MKIKTLMIILLNVLILLFLNGCISNNTNNNSSNGNDDWWENYAPTHPVGTGTGNFWIDFPNANSIIGQNVEHKTWITEDLKEKPVIFVCHRTGCASCTPQADRIKALGETYAENVVFYDLDNPFEDYGEATGDILKKYNEAFYYDPDGGTHYIALTGVFTLVNDGGEVKVGWHSWEGNVDDSEMESWVKDLIYYYNINKQG